MFVVYVESQRSGEKSGREGAGVYTVAGVNVRGDLGATHAASESSKTSSTEHA